MKVKKALITGVTGQDGSYLSEFLLNKNYIVYGVKRKSSSLNTDRIDHIYLNKKYKNKPRKNIYLVQYHIKDNQAKHPLV